VYYLKFCFNNTTRMNIFSLYFRLHVMGGGDQWPIKHIVIHVSMDVFPLLYLFLSDGIFTDGWWWWIVSTIIRITCDYIDDLLRWRLYIYIVIKVDWKSSPSKLNRYIISANCLSLLPPYVNFWLLIVHLCGVGEREMRVVYCLPEKQPLLSPVSPTQYSICWWWE
jgi:hypothetical protein